MLQDTAKIEITNPSSPHRKDALQVKFLRKLLVTGTALCTLTASSMFGATNANATIEDPNTAAHGIEVKAGESITIQLSENSANGVQIKTITPKQKHETRGPTAPACVRAVKEGLAIQVYNDCVNTERVKVIVTSVIGAQDSGCKSVEPGTRTNIRWIVPGQRIDRVESC